MLRVCYRTLNATRAPTTPSSVHGWQRGQARGTSERDKRESRGSERVHRSGRTISELGGAPSLPSPRAQGVGASALRAAKRLTPAHLLGVSGVPAHAAVASRRS